MTNEYHALHVYQFGIDNFGRFLVDSGCTDTQSQMPLITLIHALTTASVSVSQSVSITILPVRGYASTLYMP